MISPTLPVPSGSRTAIARFCARNDDALFTTE
jgi:hypothetical protein